MIRIDKITNGRFGNKILQYNTLCQLGKNNNINISCVSFDEGKFFKKIVPFKKPTKPIKLLYCKDVLDSKKLKFYKNSYQIDDPAYCLHNVFFKVTKSDPRTFLELKQEYKPKFDKDITYIGIHIRGGDIISKDGNNGREIHEFEYYKESIDFVLKKYCHEKKYKFILCTDDKEFNSYKKTLNYLKEKNINFIKGPATLDEKNHYINDWAYLSECDILINSSSTFCVTAGFLGKKNKIIIHSKKWIKKNRKNIWWKKNGDELSVIPSMKNHEYWETYNKFWTEIQNKNSFYYANFVL